MIQFIIGLFIGMCSGVMVMALSFIASDSDKYMENITNNEENINE